MMGSFVFGMLVGAVIGGMAAVHFAPPIELEHPSNDVLGIARCDDGSYVAVMTRPLRFVSTTATPDFLTSDSLAGARLGYLPYPCGKPEGK